MLKEKDAKRIAEEIGSQFPQKMVKNSDMPLEALVQLALQGITKIENQMGTNFIGWRCPLAIYF